MNDDANSPNCMTLSSENINDDTDNKSKFQSLIGDGDKSLDSNLINSRVKSVNFDIDLEGLKNEQVSSCSPLNLPSSDNQVMNSDENGDKQLFSMDETDTNSFGLDQLVDPLGFETPSDSEEEIVQD